MKQTELKSLKKYYVLNVALCIFDQLSSTNKSQEKIRIWKKM